MSYGHVVGFNLHMCSNVSMTCVCVLMSSSRLVLTSMSSDNTSIRRLRHVTPSDAVMSWVRIWPREMIWMEESGSSVRVVHRDMNSLDSVNRDFLSVSHPTTTTFCLELQGRTTGKVINNGWNKTCFVFYRFQWNQVFVNLIYSIKSNLSMK